MIKTTLHTKPAIGATLERELGGPRRTGHLPSSVQRYFRSLRLQPIDRRDFVTLSNDNFSSRVRDVVGLY